MAGGFAKDGAVQDQIDATISDAVEFARGQFPGGESLTLQRELRLAGCCPAHGNFSLRG